MRACIPLNWLNAYPLSYLKTDHGNIHPEMIAIPPGKSFNWDYSPLPYKSSIESFIFLSIILNSNPPTKTLTQLPGHLSNEETELHLIRPKTTNLTLILTSLPQTIAQDHALTHQRIQPGRIRKRLLAIDLITIAHAEELRAGRIRGT
jgi:hypothetical protein